MSKRSRAKALRISDIFDINKWNKTEEGKGKTFKHVRWIPSEGRFNVPSKYLNLKRAQDQRAWVAAYTGGDKVKIVQFAILKGGLAATENRKARLYTHKIEAFLYCNGQYTSEEVSEMVEAYNKACEDNNREDLKVVTRQFETKQKKDIFEDFWK